MLRFWSKVQVLGDGECWEWQAYKSNSGYGRFRLDGRDQLAHRVAYWLEHDEIPEGAHILHVCDNPPCCNPSHLYIGDASRNMRDAYDRGQKKPTIGELNGRAKLTPAKAKEIRGLAHALTQDHLARMFRVSQSTVSRVINGKRWQEEA